MNKFERIIIGGVKDCLREMGSMNPPNPANIKARLANQYFMCKASKHLRSAIEDMQGDDLDRKDAIKSIGLAKELLAAARNV